MSRSFFGLSTMPVWCQRLGKALVPSVLVLALVSWPAFAATPADPYADAVAPFGLTGGSTANAVGAPNRKYATVPKVEPQNDVKASSLVLDMGDADEYGTGPLVVHYERGSRQAQITVTFVDAQGLDITHATFQIIGRRSKANAVKLDYDYNLHNKRAYRYVRFSPSPQIDYKIDAVVALMYGNDQDEDGLPDDWETQYFHNLNETPSGDFDGDGLTNIQELQLGTNPTIPDTDGDGLTDGQEWSGEVTDPLDPDTDNDLVNDSQDAFPDNETEWANTDGDVWGNNTDSDDDNDGQLDTHELACGSDPLSATSKATDTDGDTTPDCVDADDDNDGTPDSHDAFPSDKTETTDTDGDGVGDNTDAFPSDKTETTDTDGDGVGDNMDAFPTDPNETKDSDKDGVGDGSDDCVNVANPGQSDADQDGIGNACEPDRDGDGVIDDHDAFPTDKTESVDTDGDGVGDNTDAFPTDETETTDSDGDGVGDNTDAFPTDKTETVDTDGDGVGDNGDAFPSDKTETTDTDGDGVGDNGDTFPSDKTETTDSDGDGVGNTLDPDDDNDGVTDLDEAVTGTNPTDADSDNDGTSDGDDALPLNPDETEDTDGDKIGNIADPDDDGDGIADADEVTNGTSPNNTGSDTDGDESVTGTNPVVPQTPNTPSTTQKSIFIPLIMR